MFTLPDALATVLESTTVRGAARLVARWPDGSQRAVYELDTSIVLGGSADYDLTRDARRSASLVLANPSGDLTPSAFDDPFAEGSWLALERGAWVDTGPMYVPLINGFVTSCEPAMRGTLSLTIESFLSAVAQPAGETIVLPAGTYIGAALRTLWEPVLPFVRWDIDDQDRALGSDLAVLPTDDRLQFGLTIARDNGLEAFDDRLGRIVVRPRPDPTTAAVVRRFPTPIDLSRRVSRRPVNAQPVEATPGQGAPIFVVATVDDPTSPIHASRIGLRMADVVRSDAIADTDTAMATARMWLAMRALAQDGVSSTEVPVLDVEEGDVVEWEERISGSVGRYRVDRISIPVVLGTTSVAATRVVPLWVTA